MRRLMAFLLVVMLISACGGPRSVTYRITGTTGNVDVTLTNASGGTEQRNIKPPYELTFDVSGSRPLYISGQNKWDAGTVTCEILVDGKVTQSATTSTAFGVATCSGRL